MTRSLRHGLIPAYLLLCLLLGGSEQGIWRNLFLQLSGIAIIGWSLLGGRSERSTPAVRSLWILAGLAVAIPLLQLIPLPPVIWSALPGRSFLVEGYRLLGQPLPWLPVSLTPYETGAAVLSLIPPAAVLLGMIRLGAYRSRWLVGALLLGMVAGVGLGALQVSGGGPYLYPVHNTGAAGLFANSNAMGSLLVVSIPFLAVLAGDARRERVSGIDPAAILAAAGAGALLVAVGIALNGSMAALALSIPVAAASSLLLVSPASRWRRAVLPFAALLGVAALAAIIARPSLSGDNLVSVTIRQDIFGRTLEAVRDFMPLGSGLASFPSVYPLYEDPAQVTRWFINHAHNDYLEIALETGIPGLAVLVLFLAWWIRQAVRLWRAPKPDRVALAATIASSALLLHSTVDFPLRSAALSAVLAVCVALMAQPRRWQEAGEPKPLRASRHLGLEPGASA